MTSTSSPPSSAAAVDELGAKQVEQAGEAQARYYETAAGNVDPPLGIVKTLLS